MDRLQALLLSFEDPTEVDVLEEDREWCMEQWNAVQGVLLSAVKPKTEPPDSKHSEDQAASSTDIVQVEDSQLEVDGGSSSQVAVLRDGTTRPLTQEELDEISYHEELERQAAEAELRADEQRWLEYRAQKLREDEEAALNEAMDNDAAPPHKKARVRVQIEGAFGRVVKSEVFDMVVKDDEALTYKIMVLPKDDPEVSSLRQMQERREQTGQEDHTSEVSPASADTVMANETGKPIPPPAVISEDKLCQFMQTHEGLVYYHKWLRGEITSRMVRERSGAGLLAKFFSKKTDDEEDEKMVEAAVAAEKVKSGRCEDTGPADAGEGCGSGHGSSSATPHESATLSPPAVWPSFTLKPCTDTLQLASQDSGQNGVEGGMAEPEYAITAEENERELQFAIAAGDVPANATLSTTHGSAGSTTSASDSGIVAAVEQGHVELDEGDMTRPASTSEGHEGLKGQSSLKHWLK